MDENIIIKVEGLRKKFCRSLKRSMFYGAVDMGRSMLGIPYDRAGLRPAEFHALDGIDFELKRGEALGVIGRNGSGKTTLLRLITGILPPDAGKISIRGRMGALIALGAGFHPQMTGRENIFLNGTLLGMSRREIAEKFDEIIDFADIAEFIDAPVCTYSSGMTVRLGFSIAAHADPEIILADEVLAVGDLRFILKCYRRISQFRENGGSIILVSHGMPLVRNTCQRVLWLDEGRQRALGETQTVCDEYERLSLAADREEVQGRGTVINNDPLARITRIEFLDESGHVTTEFPFGGRFRARISYECRRPVRDPVFSFTAVNPEELAIVADFTKYGGLRIPVMEGVGYVEYDVERLPLKPSEYRCVVTFAENGDINNILDWHDKTCSFSVRSTGPVCQGLIGGLPTWRHISAQSP